MSEPATFYCDLVGRGLCYDNGEDEDKSRVYYKITAAWPYNEGRVVRVLLIGASVSNAGELSIEDLPCHGFTIC